MVRELKTVVRDYYANLNRAFRTKELCPESLPLAEHANFIGINEFFEGKDRIIQLLSKTIFMIREFDIQRQYFDHESCCTVMEIITTIPDVRVSNIEWIVVKDGQVVEINTVYDARAWQQYMRLSQTRNSAVGYDSQY